MDRKILTIDDAPFSFIELGSRLLLSSDQRVFLKRADGVPVVIHAPASPLLPQDLRPTKGPGIEDWIKKSILDPLGFNKDFRDTMSEIGSFVGNITSIVGWVNTAIQMAQALGIIGKKSDAMEAINEKLEKVLSLLRQIVTDKTIDDLVNVRSDLQVAREALIEFVNTLRGNPQAASMQYQRLLANLDHIKRVKTRLLDPRFQKFLYHGRQYIDTPWHFYWPWFTERAVLTASLFGIGSNEQAPIFANLRDDQVRWDYRLFLLPVLDSVALILAMYEALDPHFRTTGRFRGELETLLAELKTFAASMMGCIQWTHDYDELWNYPFMGSFPPWTFQPEQGWPVGAADVCSALSVFDPAWTEGIVTGGTDPRTSVDMPTSKHNARIYRAPAADAVFNESAIPKLLSIISSIEEISRPPEVSETINPERLLIWGGRRDAAGSTRRRFEATALCPAVEVDADIYDIHRQATISITTQPVFYKRHTEYVISYHFYVESYLFGDAKNSPSSCETRKSLDKPKGTVTLKARVFDFEVKVSNPLLKDPPQHHTIKQPGDAPAKYAKATPEDFRGGGSGRQTNDQMVSSIARIMLRNEAAFPWTSLGKLKELEGMAVNFREEDINLDYEVEINDELTVIRLTNRPSEECFKGVYVVIEEQPGPKGADLPPIRTVIDLGEIVGREYHVPEWFLQYREGCLIDLAEVVGDIGRRSISLPDPIPAWNPHIFPDINEYINLVRTTHPELLPAELRNKP